MSVVTIEYDTRAKRYLFACECSWHGSTADWFTVTAPLAEHLKSCAGERPKHRYTPDKFRNARRRELVQRPAPKPNGNAKLDDAKVREIRQRYADGDLQQDIARDFGITQAAVHGIVRRKTWQHVD